MLPWPIHSLEPPDLSISLCTRPFKDLGHVLLQDAENLGLEVEDRRQRTEKLLAKAGDGELRKVRARAGDGATVDTVKDAQALREKVGGG